MKNRESESANVGITEQYWVLGIGGVCTLLLISTLCTLVR